MDTINARGITGLRGGIASAGAVTAAAAMLALGAFASPAMAATGTSNASASANSGTSATSTTSANSGSSNTSSSSGSSNGSKASGNENANGNGNGNGKTDKENCNRGHRGAGSQVKGKGECPKMMNQAATPAASGKTVVAGAAAAPQVATNNRQPNAQNLAAPAANAVAGKVRARAGRLPFTGAPSWMIAVIGWSFLAGGLTLYAMARPARRGSSIG